MATSYVVACCCIFPVPIYDTYIKLANEINKYSSENKLNLPIIQVNNIKQDELKNSIEVALIALGKTSDEISTQKEVFSVDLKCNIDWYAWEKLSREKGYFYFINKP